MIVALFFFVRLFFKDSAYPSAHSALPLGVVAACAVSFSLLSSGVLATHSVS
jgi:hypothetical protein